MDTTDDPAAYTAIGGEPFITWPLPSPTSRLGINIRFYSIDEGEEIGARYRVDIGASHERNLEQMYFDFELASRGTTPQEFEETVRGMFQPRIAFLNAYAIATLLYVAFTTDPKEMGRMADREQRTLRSQGRRFPYMAYAKYVDIPTTIFGNLKFFIRYTIAKLFHI